ncbi:stage III sporulation protein AH [Gracilibacillus ureilyticus]|uniref:Stage III sporulation protein AH n=1 Tax=Gracilibacillus ureilyticus TaxID=531814 RepID=A0A1H9LXX2_9BACI|nr:SpoIIIAH-like family protein [Gracilibacillus ureilyticus]SER16047.1 stage III sporulation protein AH [Gracilibacillus ureilyticus]
MLKKQTVWLLTMLSLMIVLSVYYLNAPNEGDLAYFDTDLENQDQVTSQSLNNSGEEGITDLEDEEELAKELDTSSISSEEHFAAVRMEITNQRSMEKERLETIVASAEATSEEKSQAYEAMKEIELLESKETIVEDMIKSSNGFEEVLVRNVSDGNVVVTVQVDSLTSKEANQIIQQTKQEFGEVDIEVVYQTN